MKIKGLLTQMSGSLGGITASHNRGGLYLRSRTVPTDPSTPQQQAVRNIMASLSVGWNDNLTQDQRDAWDLYADNVTVIDALGDEIKLSGLNHYVRSNVPLLQASFAREDDAPVTFNIGEFTAMEMTASEAAQEVQITFTNTDAWANDTNGHALIYVSRPHNPTKNWFRGPYRLAGTIDGGGTPPTSPADIAVPFTITEDQRVFARIAVAMGDGRYTASQFLRATVAA